MLFLEHRLLRIKPSFSSEASKYWIQAFITKILDGEDVPLSINPDHFSASLNYKKFIQLCYELRHRPISITTITDTLKRTFNISDQLILNKLIIKNIANHQLNFFISTDAGTNLILHYSFNINLYHNNSVITIKLDGMRVGYSDDLWCLNYSIISTDLNQKSLLPINTNLLYENLDMDSTPKLLQLKVHIQKQASVKEELGWMIAPSTMNYEYLNFDSKQYCNVRLPFCRELDYIDVIEVMRNFKEKYCRIDHYFLEKNIENYLVRFELLSDSISMEFTHIQPVTQGIEPPLKMKILLDCNTFTLDRFVLETNGAYQFTSLEHFDQLDIILESKQLSKECRQFIINNISRFILSKRNFIASVQSLCSEQQHDYSRIFDEEVEQRQMIRSKTVQNVLDIEKIKQSKQLMSHVEGIKRLYLDIFQAGLTEIHGRLVVEAMCLKELHQYRNHALLNMEVFKAKEQLQAEIQFNHQQFLHDVRMHLMQLSHTEQRHAVLIQARKETRKIAAK